jgi:hypothetical protein
LSRLNERKKNLARISKIDDKFWRDMEDNFDHQFDDASELHHATHPLS